MYTNELTLEGRLRALLRELQSGARSEEEVALRIRGEVIAGFFRGSEAEKKRAEETRCFR